MEVSIPRHRAVRHRRSMKRRLPWRCVAVIIPLSSIAIASTVLSGLRCAAPTTHATHACTFLTAEAFLAPLPIPRTPFHIHSLPSTLVADAPTITPSSAEEWTELVRRTAFTADGRTSLSSSAAARPFEVGGGWNKNRSYVGRYGGRASATDGSIRISDGRGNGIVAGGNGILGFDVGLSMLPSELQLSAVASASVSASALRMGMDTARTIQNPNSPIKKQVIYNLPTHTPSTSYLRNSAATERRNRMRTTNDVSLLENDARQQHERATSVPVWFPYIPTQSQIQTLKLVQLKDACSERNIRKTGNKADLQERLLSWTREQHDRTIKPTKLTTSTDDDNTSNQTHDDTVDDYRMGDIDPLIQRRKALLMAHENRKHTGQTIANRGALGFDTTDRQHPHPLLSPSKTYLSQLTQTYHSSASSPTSPASSNNYHFQRLYLRAKHADQAGDLPTARRHLNRLRQITRNQDTRVLRRLARLEVRTGHADEARRILQGGLRKKGGEDAYLLQGLGNLDLARGDVEGAAGWYRRAVGVAPNGYANPHHALGVLEYTRGNIRTAARVLRVGLDSCPTNHRLHHALGDLYREAKMGELAEIEYRKGLQCIDAEMRAKGGRQRTWGKSFFYASLGYLAYDRVQTDECRRWLWKSVDHEGGNSKHAQGWLALAQLEESEGRFDVARNVYKRAIENYETKRRIVWSGTTRSPRRPMDNSDIIPANMGDRWLHVYNSWVNMEESQGATYEELNNLHSRAAVAFPDDWKNLQRWARLQVRYERHERARTLFELARDRAGSRNAEPHRLYAEYEMSLDNHHQARSILFHGAQALSQSSDGAMGNSVELSKLYHTWGVCEWHLQNFDRAETLFDHALRLTDSREAGSPIRMLVLYSIARLLFHAREDCVLAQHCICLALTESAVARFGDRSRMWTLWADIARGMDNGRLAGQCVDQAGKVRSADNTMVQSTVMDLNMPSDPSEIPLVSAPAMHQLLRKAPWYHKVAHQGQRDGMSWYNGVTFPDANNVKENSKEDSKENSDVASLSIC